MQATSRTARRSAPAVLNAARERPSVCLSCRLTLRQQTRSAATATAPAPTQSSSPSTSSPPKPQQSYRVLASVVVSRPPLLTRPLTAFEKAYHLYNRRLNERLALPFTRYFYYKKGTPQDGEWKRKIRARNTAARDIGSYSGYGDEAWNDEVLVGSKLGEWEHTVEQVIRDAEEFNEDTIRAASLEGTKAEKGEGKTEGETDVVSTQEGQSEGAIEESQPPAQDDFMQAAATVKKEAVPRPAPRVTGADEANDTKSLSRKMDRTLYLLVKNAAGRWVFPADLVQGKEGLHQAAERVLVQAGGINMNTWIVGNAPIGHHKFDFSKALTQKDTGVEEVGEKTFFMKARIMTGQADISKNVLGDTDFCWLAKDEIAPLVGPRYWSAVKNMLAER